MRLIVLIMGSLSLVPAIAPAQTSLPPANSRPVVVELFTSQGCSSCPPADALVAELAEARPDLLPLTFHVTYWNNLGWQDPFSFKEATDRQRRYVALSVSPEVYTPAMVVDGQFDVVGSDRPRVAAALAQARTKAGQADGVTLDVVRRGGTLSLSVGPGAGTAQVLLIGYDRLHRTAIGRGENGGRTLREANIVRSMAALATWTGTPLQLDVPLPVGEQAAVLIQAADGRIIGAARAS